MNPQTEPAKSSFIKDSLSKEDWIIQFLRPRWAAQVQTHLSTLDRFVSDVDTLTSLGVTMTPGGSTPMQVTPADLKANLDEFAELQLIAKEGRAFLDKLGYVSQRRLNPIAGSAPVGQQVQVRPIEVQLPGQEPVAGAVVQPVTSPVKPAK